MSKKLKILISVIVLIICVSAILKYRDYKKLKIIDGEQYVIGQVYEYTSNMDYKNVSNDEGKETMRYVFQGYNKHSVVWEGESERMYLPAFRRIDKDNNPTGIKIWTKPTIILGPTESTSLQKVEELTKKINAKIIKQPGIPSWNNYYVIAIPDKQNIFDILNYYEDNENFEFSQPDWISTTTEAF